jgi:hypothetical protein
VNAGQATAASGKCHEPRQRLLEEYIATIKAAEVTHLACPQVLSNGHPLEACHSSKPTLKFVDAFALGISNISQGRRIKEAREGRRESIESLALYSRAEKERLRRMRTAAPSEIASSIAARKILISHMAFAEMLTKGQAAIAQWIQFEARVQRGCAEAVQLASLLRAQDGTLQGEDECFAQVVKKAARGRLDAEQEKGEEGVLEEMHLLVEMAARDGPAIRLPMKGASFKA